MSTRANIAKVNLDGSIDCIYSHWDGYPTWVGKTLEEHYINQEKIDALIALGSISSLAEEVAPPEGAKHTFNEPLPNVTVAYHRDRGEESEIRHFDNQEEFENYYKTEAGFIEYVYLWNGKEWKVSNLHHFKAPPLVWQSVSDACAEYVKEYES